MVVYYSSISLQIPFLADLKHKKAPALQGPEYCNKMITYFLAAAGAAAFAAGAAALGADASSCFN